VITRQTKLKLIAFAMLAVLGMAYLGFKYVGLDRVLLGTGYDVAADFKDSGGIFVNAEVTYRGVAVGRVGDMRLTDRGMEADLLLDDSAPSIPVDTKAVVANRSAIGEQYVDLQPRGDGAPFLTDGAVIRREQTSVPMPVTTLLSNLSALNESVPTESLRVVVDELYTALNDTGPSLQVLLDSTMSFTDEAANHLPQTTTLINDGAKVLQTQLDSSTEWREFSSNAKLFAHELASADGDLRQLIGAAPQAATELSHLLADTNPGLPVLLANLTTTAEIFESRIGGMRQLFVNLPRAVAATSTAIQPDDPRLSIALTFWNPPPCATGYNAPYREGEDTSEVPFDTTSACTLPYGDERLVRGSQNAPQGGVPDPVIPGGGATMPGPLGAPDLPQASTVEELLWLEK
jgi:phospholipid/cholesterol/gamma-HCH transport system substrate-binding protein